MKAVGLVVEYNPFHNGHAYQLSAARELSKADTVIAVMSGNFLQRGEPALLSKWYRAKMALLGGADIVLELPYRFATQKAETFAGGAVSILDAIGCDSLCFGSESGDIFSFSKTLAFMENHLEDYEKNIRKNIKTGVSYPKALALSFQQLQLSDGLVDLSAPNNILGIQYMKSIQQQKSPMKAYTVKRKSAGYHDEYFSAESIASATSIRKALFSGNKDTQAAIKEYVPPRTYNILKEYYDTYGLFHHWETYWPYLQFRLLQTEPEELKDIYEVEEGIENRLKNAVLQAGCFQEFMEKVKTKRYTWTRLQRICTHILTNTKKVQMKNGPDKAGYLRLLGMTDNGRNYLNKNKSHFALPLISKLSAFKQEEIFLDIRAAQIYSFVLPKPYKEAALAQEYKQTPLYLTGPLLDGTK